ncbi:MAG: Re/Si-specific NAD(P)(+) transhydrogenase subunit alpha [Acidiferrobacterales bacterium]|nr:Re/Si-specific NAD(P)(+) transhydrogenase subunit alpha [Acidiferrobacterales bacterium]
MKIGIPTEIHDKERRVAVTPEIVPSIMEMGFEVVVESGAGELANYTDSAYETAGATVVSAGTSVWENSDVIAKVRAPEFSDSGQYDEADLLSSGQHLIAFLWPAQNPELLQKLSDKGVSAISMDAVPRISRAQKLDALSSMANVAGYRAVVEAAQHFGRFFSGQITAAGRVPPAKIMIIGAGVAGLSAIGTATSLGAIVRAFDTRPEVKEQVESMGAEFLELDFEEEGSGSGGYAKVMSKEFIEAEMALFAEQAEDVDIIITTALIPGRPAPKLITEAMVRSMKTGSVIVDLAAEQGGNCELTQPDEATEAYGVTIIGYTDLPSRLPSQSSQLYASNIRNFLDDLCPDRNGEIMIDMEDEVIRGATVVHNGEITWPPPQSEPPKPLAQKPADEVAPSQGIAAEEAPESKKFRIGPYAFGLALAAIVAVGLYAPASFLTHFTVFVLAIFVGWHVIWNVTPSLHTPLMSVTNAISGIIIVGALLEIGAVNPYVKALAAVSILIASINIFGGFLVTQRMLRMFKK